MTQLAPRTETFGAGDQSWLGSRHGTETPRSVSLARAPWASKLTGDRLKSGEPFALVNGLAVPYNSAGTGGTEVLAGFIFTDQVVAAGLGNCTAPAIWHGRILLSKLPSPVAADATTSGLFVLEA